jgi:predicted amidohydrolase YtcJ
VRTLYRNARIYSPSNPYATAMLVEDGIITWLGQQDGVAQHGGVQVVDAQDCLIAPAFVDAHVHATSAGLALTGLDLSSAASLADALDLVERAARAARGRPLLGSGWDETRWPEHRAPTSAELDRAAYGGAVYLARVDVHSAVVSSALAAAVPGLADLEGYGVNGRMTKDAHHAVREAAMKALTSAQIREAQLATLQRAASLGIACVHEMAGPAISSADDLAGLLSLASEQPLPEVIAYWGELFGIETARELGAVGAGGDLFCDGSLGSHTAALHQPYADDAASSGVLYYDTRDLAEHITRCADAGLQSGFHVIGDAAIDQVLDAYEVASQRLGRSAGAGQRLEHVEYVSEPARLAASGLMASMQPMFDALWGGSAGMYAERLGAPRAAGLNRFAELASCGVPLAFGSDAPVTELGPWQAVQAAAYPHDPGAAISPRAAFTAHTRAGWRIANRFEEGVLNPGMPATFALWQAGETAVEAPDERVERWSTDPRANIPGLPDIAPGSELPTCRATVLRGQTIFEDGINSV